MRNLLPMPANLSQIGQNVESINDLIGGKVDHTGIMDWLLEMVRYRKLLNPLISIPLTINCFALMTLVSP